MREKNNRIDKVINHKIVNMHKVKKKNEILFK